MVPFRTTGEVFDAIQKVKAEAPAFCTNFFPVQQKLEDWLERGSVFGEIRDGVAFILRKECDFWRLYFCAASAAALQREMPSLSLLKEERLVADLIGKEPGLEDLLKAFGAAGFQRYGRLQRMARLGYKEVKTEVAGDLQVVPAEPTDREEIIALLNSSFDRYADQLPTDEEIDVAIRNEQILTVKRDGEPAAMLFFETQGLTSTIRYWVVAKEFRSSGFGSVLMRQYLAVHSSTRRFILWVGSENRNAVRSYEHYGYVADGLIDHVLINERIQL